MRDTAVPEDVRNAFQLDLENELKRPKLGAALRSQAPEAPSSKLKLDVWQVPVA